MTEVNYTDEQTAELVNRYQAGEPIEQLALQAGKTTRSIIAKLVHEGVYKRASNPRARRATKLEMLAAIEGQFGLEAGVLASLAKADRAAVEILFGCVSVLDLEE